MCFPTPSMVLLLFIFANRGSRRPDGSGVVLQRFLWPRQLQMANRVGYRTLSAGIRYVICRHSQSHPWVCVSTSIGVVDTNVQIGPNHHHCISPHRLQQVLQSSTTSFVTCAECLQVAYSACRGVRETGQDGMASTPSVACVHIVAWA